VLLCLICFFLGQSFRQQTAGLLSAGEQLKEQSAQFQAPSGNALQSRPVRSTQHQLRPTGLGSPKASCPKDRRPSTAKGRSAKKQTPNQHSADSELQPTRLASAGLPRARRTRDRLSANWRAPGPSVSKDRSPPCALTTLKPSDDAAGQKRWLPPIWDIGQQKGMLVAKASVCCPPAETYHDLGIRHAQSPALPNQRRPLPTRPNRVRPHQLHQARTRVENISRVIILHERRAARLPQPSFLLPQQLMRRGFRHTAGLQLQMRLLAPLAGALEIAGQQCAKPCLKTRVPARNVWLTLCGAPGTRTGHLQDDVDRRSFWRTLREACECLEVQFQFLFAPFRPAQEGAEMAHRTGRAASIDTSRGRAIFPC